LYGGEAALSRREFFAIVDGVRKRHIADNVVELGGNLVAVESKFTGSWGSSPFSPASSVGRLPFAVKIQSEMLAQARAYSQAFGQFGYHTNSPKLIAHYTKLFQEARITNFRFILTP
jgi:filamentous hemagglutinin